jgi:DNA-binding XRE family transcriptional regulator
MINMINRVVAKELVKKGGWTQHALSTATGIHMASLYRILSGRQEPRVSTAIRIARCLTVSVEDLFFADRDQR